MRAQVPEPVTDAGILVGLLLSVFALLGALWALIGGKRHLTERKANREFQRQFREDWQGVPGRPGVPERLGVMATFAALRDDWAAMRERVRKLELELVAVRGQVNILHNRMDHYHGPSDAEDAQG